MFIIDMTFQCFEDFLLEGARGGPGKMVTDFLFWTTLNFTNGPLLIFLTDALLTELRG